MRSIVMITVLGFTLAGSASAGSCRWSGNTVVCNGDDGGQTRYWRDGDTLRYQSTPGLDGYGYGRNPYVRRSLTEGIRHLQQQEADIALTRAQTEELEAQTEERRLLIELMRRELGAK